MAIQKTDKPASKLEKEQIRDLLKAGNSIDEVKARFPHVDGRVISGTKKHLDNQAAGSSTIGSPPPPPAATAVAPAAPPPVTIAPGPSAASAAVESSRTGFSPERGTAITRDGFRPDWQEYYVVKKLDPPGDGIKGTEYPPFDIKMLAERYGPGDYQVQLYRDGRLHQTFRDRVAPRDPGQASADPRGIRPEPPRPVSPVDDALKLANVLHSATAETRAAEAAARHVEAAAKVEEVKGKVQVETSAQVALMQVMKDVLAGKEVKDPIIPELMTLLKSNQDTSKKSLETELEMMRARSKIEMDEVRERAKMERDAERERRKDEMDRFKLDLQERQKIQNDFMTKMAEIEQERQRLNEEWREKAMSEYKDMRESVSAELEERRRMNDEMIKIQKQSADDWIKMRKEMGAGANDIKVAEIIERGITTSLDRIGARIDLLAGPNGIKGTGTATAAAKPSAGAAGTTEEIKTAEAVVKNTEEGKVFDEDSLKTEFERPWFKQWKAEVIGTLKKRAQGLKIDGSLMGQVFIDKLNTGEVKPMHIQWLLTRTWRARDAADPKGLLDFAAHVITDDEAKILATDDGDKWFQEFVWFIAEVWNQNIAQARAARQGA